MASKTIDHMDMYVAIAPYEHQGQKYNELNVTVAYRKGVGFNVHYHPGYDKGNGVHTCIFDFSKDPLTSTTYVEVKEATKNSVKTLEQMRTNLEQAKDAIAWLFDHRDWTRLQAAVKNIALFGYHEKFRQQMEELMAKENDNSDNQDNNQSTSNSTIMATIEMNNESKNAAQQQVNNEVESVAVGEVTLNTILPKMTTNEPTKQDVAQAISKAATEGTATTMPIGTHGTLVIAGVGGGEKPTEEKPKVTLRKKTPQPEAAETLPRLTLVVYETRRHEKAPRIEGFAGEDDPRWKRHHDEKVRLKALKEQADKKNEALKKQMKGKTKAEKEALMKRWVVVPNDPFNASYFTDRTTGEKTYSLVMGAKYLDVARQLVDAYNTPDRDQWAQAEQAVADVKQGIVAEKVAEREARKQERAAQREAQSATAQSAAQQPTVGYTDEQVAAMLRQIMAGGAIPEGIKQAMAKAA